MSTQTLIRWSGLMALSAGAFWALYEIGELVGVVPLTLDTPLDLVTHMVVALAVIGLYARQAEQAGRLGTAAFLIWMMAAMLNQGIKYIYTFCAPVLMAQFPDAAMAIVAGPFGKVLTLWMVATTLANILFGLATLRAGVLPRWAATLLVVGPIVSLTVTFLPGNLGAVLTSIGIAGLGHAVWTHQVATRIEPHPATVGV